MKKIIIDEQGNKLKITSNMHRIPLKQFEDFTEKQQAEMLTTFDYADDINDLTFINEYTSFNEVIRCYNNVWLNYDKNILKALESVFNKANSNNNHDYTFGIVEHGYFYDLYAIDSGLYENDCYIKINVTIIATPEGE